MKIIQLKNTRIRYGRSPPTLVHNEQRLKEKIK